jgi:hypothetical protein
MKYFRNLGCYTLIIVLFMQLVYTTITIVQKVYNCSDLTTYFMVPLSDKKVTCIETNYTISSFSPVNYMLQVNFQEGVMRTSPASQ